MRQRRLRQEEIAEDVGLERPLELVLGDVADVLVGVLLAGIVDEDVEPPSSSTVCFTARSQNCLSPTSPAIVIARRPSFDDLLRLRGIVMFAEVKIATSAPSRAKSAATARPMPLSAPVIRATLPFKRSDP